MSNIQFFSGVFPSLTPHLMVVIGIVIAALWNLFSPKLKQVTPIATAISLLAAALIYYGQLDAKTTKLFAELYTSDKLSTAFGLMSCLVGLIVTLMTMGYEHKFGENRGEFYTILLTATLSVMFLAGTTDLIMLFVALETLTICCVLLSGMAKRDKRSNEAALKYLLSTAATTATFMYGLTFLYGLTGSTNFYEIQAKFYQVAQIPSMVAMLLMVLLISVVGFKLSIVPFHMWTPDVYEGAPTPVTAFLSVGSKLGGLVVALRMLTMVFGSAASSWIPVLGILAILSMIAGNLIALCQTSVKRMLAYSSIAHVGYFLIAFCANTTESLSAVVFYIIVYGLMNLGAFTAAIMIENELGSDNMNDWSGLILKRPFVTVALAVCLLNLGGLPVPPAGFLAKFFVFWSGIEMVSTLGYVMVAVGLLTSIPAVFYYSRVAIKTIVAEPSELVAALPERRIALADSQFGPIVALLIAIAGLIATSSSAITPLMEFSGKAVSAVSQPVVGSLKSNNVIGQVPSDLH
ncbi:MAG: NADH-quinone oxidoreductase subunit NuoN [Candidatus Obscuribacterales bacterium]|nr:NADH-quinone oxidoreductase subunit NuoN [Candidatus Obscuribacterales bacterium]